MRGTAMTIHSTNEMDRPRAASAPRAIAFGGVPTGVPMPPMLAATGIARATPAFALASGMAAMIGMTTANMAAVVAVFDMNIDRAAVISMSPSTVRRPEPANGFMNTAARLWSSPNLAAPSAIRKPPRNRMMTGFASEAK